MRKFARWPRLELCSRVLVPPTMSRRRRLAQTLTRGLKTSHGSTTFGIRKSAMAITPRGKSQDSFYLSLCLTTARLNQPSKRERLYSWLCKLRLVFKPFINFDIELLSHRCSKIVNALSNQSCSIRELLDIHSNKPVNV